MIDSFSNLISVEVILLFWFVLIFVVIFIARIKENSKQKKILEQLALKWNGTVKGGSFFSYPLLSIPQSGRKILICSTNGGKNSPPCTLVVYNLSSIRDYKIKICREYHIFGVGTVFGQDIQTKNPAFNEAYLVKGSDEMIVRSFLTPEIQANLLKLKKYKPVLEIKKNKFTFSIPSIPKNENQYNKLIDAGIKLIKHTKTLG